jgi:hypothetical protein
MNMRAKSIKTTKIGERAMTPEKPNGRERANEPEKTKVRERAKDIEKTNDGERAIMPEKTRRPERATMKDKPMPCERAGSGEKTRIAKRATCDEKTITEKRPTFDDVLAVRTLVRAREDFQLLRQKMDNRIGRKANGKSQEVEERAFRAEDAGMFADVADAARAQEDNIQKLLKKVLKRFPIWTEYLINVKGVGEIAAGWIIGEFDIHKASTVSKLWQFAGLNPGMVRGKKRHEDEDGNVTFEVTDTMIRGDRLTPGFVSPFNKNLRTALVGVLADGFIKQQNSYCLDFYYSYKERLEQEENKVFHVGKEKPWKDVTKGHRDRAAKRYMIKMFLKDLYAAWREIEGLPVRAPYKEEYLGHKHSE